MTLLLLKIAIIQGVVFAIGWIFIYPSESTIEYAERKFGDWGKMARIFFLPQAALFCVTLLAALINYMFF